MLLPQDQGTPVGVWWAGAAATSWTTPSARPGATGARSAAATRTRPSNPRMGRKRAWWATWAVMVLLAGVRAWMRGASRLAALVGLGALQPGRQQRVGGEAPG